MDIGGVYIVSFPRKGGNEIHGQHYAVVLSSVSKDDKTLLVAPITENTKQIPNIPILLYISEKYKRLIKEKSFIKKRNKPMN